MTYLLDTDILIFYFNRKEPFTGLVESLLNKSPLALSVLTITEIRTGWTTERAATYMPQLYNLFQIEPVTQDIAEQAGVWRREYRTQGKTIPTPDMIIAATSHLKHYCLVTNNRKDYPMPQLHLYRDLFI